MSASRPAPGLRAADFERALASRPWARSEHFVLHHVPQGTAGKLSTGENPGAAPGVEDCPRLGLVVPKRHARRSVTRSLIKRQGRAAFALAVADARLAPGDWLLRLRSPYPVAQFPSAASSALRASVRTELQRLFGGAAGRRP